MTHIPGHFQTLRPPVNRLGGQRPTGFAANLSPFEINMPMQGQVQPQPFGAPVPLNRDRIINTPVGTSSLRGNAIQNLTGQQNLGAPQGFNVGQQAQAQGAPPEIVALINQGMTPQQAQAQFQGQQSFQNPAGANFPQQQAQQFGPPTPANQLQPLQIGEPQALPQQNVPQTGLIGSEQALQAGLQGSLGALNQFGQAGLQSLAGGQTQANQLLGQARGDILGGFGQGQQAITGAIGQGVQGLQGFQEPGQGAFDLLSAQLGVGGPQAQQQALQNFQFGPGVDFQVEQGRRLLGSGAAATGGGTRGGDFTRDLTRFSQGLAQQDLARQQGLLSNLGGQGLQAAGQIGQLRGQQAGLQGSLFGQQAGQLGNLGQFGAGQAFNFGQAGAGLLSNLGINQANLLTGAGRDVSAGRLGTGQDIATALGAGAGDVAGLQERGGAGLSDILGGATGAAADIQTQFGNLSAGDQQILLNALVNLGVGQGSQLAGQPSPAQFLTGQGTLQGLGQLAGGIGGLLTGIGDL